jgi:hypothetical protein
VASAHLADLSQIQAGCRVKRAVPGQIVLPDATVFAVSNVDETSRMLPDVAGLLEGETLSHTIPCSGILSTTFWNSVPARLKWRGLQRRNGYIKPKGLMDRTSYV